MTPSRESREYKEGKLQGKLRRIQGNVSQATRFERRCNIRKFKFLNKAIVISTFYKH